MLTSGDIVDLDLGLPEGREAGFPRPVVIVTAQRILDKGPSVVHVVPLTSTIRTASSEVDVQADATTGLSRSSVAQCQHIRAVSPRRIAARRGNVGQVVLAQIRETIALIVDVPG